MRNLKKNNAMMRTSYLLVSTLFVVSGCYSGGNNTGVEYAPNMYVSEAYEAYTQTADMKYNPYGMTMRMPVKGSVARGQLNYLGYPEGYEASSTWKDPILATEMSVAEGGRLYVIYCEHCHGKTGKNDGGVIKTGQYPPPPFANYQTDYIKDLPDGKIFHAITYGKGSMGSHSSVLTPEERWKVLRYVRKLSLGDDFVYENEASVQEQTQDPNLTGIDAKPAWLTDYAFADVNAAEYAAMWDAMKQVSFDNIRFVKMKDESEPYLDQVAEYMSTHADLKAVIVGHISSDAKLDALQEGLSKIRAKAVVNYLVERGIDVSRFTSEGKGADQPIAPNDTKEGREKNRRVEIYFIK